MLNDPETRQVLKALTEAIEVGNLHSPSREIVEDAIALCEARLARVVEPVAWIGCNAITGKPFAQMPSDPRSDVCAPWIPAFATPQAAAQPIPKGYVKASEAIDVRTIHAQLHDIWCELNAVDTVLGDQHRLMTKVEKLRDACGAAVNCMIPLEAAAQPSQAVEADSRLLECATRLVEHADFKLGGMLSADSKARDIPSNAVSDVKSRHLAALRDCIAAINAKGAP